MTLSPERAREIAQKVNDEHAHRNDGSGSTLAPWALATENWKARAVSFVTAGYAAAVQDRTASLTDDEIVREYNAAFVGRDHIRFQETSDDTQAATRCFAHRIASRVAGPDVDRIRREAAREALTKYMARWNENSLAYTDAQFFRDREYPPLPSPVPSVTLANGDVVTTRKNMIGETRICRIEPNEDESNAPLHHPANWMRCITHSDTGADFDAVKALAVRVGEGK